MTPIIITIGDTGKGGWWYAIEPQEVFADGFETEAEAIQSARAAVGAAPHEFWYQCEDAENRVLMVPGARSRNHPEEV